MLLQLISGKIFSLSTSSFERKVLLHFVPMFQKFLKLIHLSWLDQWNLPGVFSDSKKKKKRSLSLFSRAYLKTQFY